MQDTIETHQHTEKIKCLVVECVFVCRQRVPVKGMLEAINLSKAGWTSERWHGSVEAEENTPTMELHYTYQCPNQR